MKTNNTDKQAEKIIKSYILAHIPKLKKRAVIVTLIFVPLCLIQMLRLYEAFCGSAVPFGEGRSSGYVYADIAASGERVADCYVEFPMCGYYIAEKAEGGHCILAIKDADDENAVFLPAQSSTTRIYGTVRALPDSERDRIISALSEPSAYYAAALDELFASSSSDSYKDAFYIDVGDRDVFDAAVGPVSLIFLLTFFWLTQTVPYFKMIGNASTSLRRLKKRGMISQAAEELQSDGNYKFISGSAAATEHFIFCRDVGTALCYDDIVSVYPMIARFKNISFGYICTDTARRRGLYTVPLGSEDIDSRASDAIEIIKAHAPSAAVGAAVRKYYHRSIRVKPNPVSTAAQNGASGENIVNGSNSVDDENKEKGGTSL